jgi:S-(hydroxymethyl)glutathione dehydrogenase / alcohol dehydrogenase
MKAAVSYGYGQPLVIEDVELDPPGKGEVKVRIGAASICHSDIHDFKGEHGISTFPAMGGHEAAGWVDEVGEGVTYVKKGDPVMVTIVTMGCGECNNCIKGIPFLCEKKEGMRRPQTEFHGLSAPGRCVNKKGQRLPSMSGRTMAAFAEYTTVPVQALVKIPANMRIDSASLLSCAVISGFGAVFHHARVPALSSVAVVGSGGVGLNVIQSAKIAGAYPVIAIDILDSKLEVARSFGATHTVNSQKEKDPIEAVYKLTGGKGVEYAFVVVAGTKILRQAFYMTGFRGTTVILGHGYKEPLTDFQPVDFVATDRVLTGCAMGGTRFNIRIDIPKIIDLYQAGIYKLDELITGHYKLEQINEAIQAVENGMALRNVIMF